MIIIIGFSNDQTIIHTVTAARYLSVRFVFFDLREYVLFGQYYWDYKQHVGYFGYGKIRFQLPNHKITGIYSRIINIFADRKGRRNQFLSSRIQALLDILSDLRGIKVVNRTDIDFSNSSKIYHLYLLSKCGFSIPDSFLTNNHKMAREFLNNKNIIYKGASSEKTITTSYVNNQSSRLDLLKNSPVLFQERIKGFDVRTHLVGSNFYSESIKSDTVDYRFDAGQKIFQKVIIPKSIEQKCLVYQKLSGIEFIGFDFKVTESGEYFIFEANSMPGYDVYDKRNNYSISKSLLKILTGK